MFTDNQIQVLLSTPKTVENKTIKWVTQRQSKQCDIDLISKTGLKFVLYIRQNINDDDNFSCGLRLIQNGQEDITLTRYNGSNHTHTNTIENEQIDFECHIHQATERYQLIGKKIDSFALATTRYTDLRSAIKCLLQDCAIDGLQLEHLLPQGGLFDE